MLGAELVWGGFADRVPEDGGDHQLDITSRFAGLKLMKNDDRYGHFGKIKSFDSLACRAPTQARTVHGPYRVAANPLSCVAAHM